MLGQNLKTIFKHLANNLNIFLNLFKRSETCLPFLLFKSLSYKRICPQTQVAKCPSNLEERALSPPDLRREAAAERGLRREAAADTGYQGP
jgi:hypothetical protein